MKKYKTGHEFVTCGWKSGLWKFKTFTERQNWIFLVFSVFLFGFIFNLSIFLKNRLITGVEGSYYLIQVRGLLTSGELIYGDPPLAFILLVPFCILMGDLMLGVKVGVSFLCALSTIPAFYLKKRRQRILILSEIEHAFLLTPFPSHKGSLLLQIKLQIQGLIDYVIVILYLTSYRWSTPGVISASNEYVQEEKD